MMGMIGFIAYGAAAVACLLAAWWVAAKATVKRTDRSAMIVALSATAAWCLAIAALGVDRPLGLALEIARNLAWLFVLFRLFGNDRRDESVRLVRPLLLVLAFVELLQAPLIVLSFDPAFSREITLSVFQTSALFRVLLAVGALVLLHNLFAGATTGSRRLIAWTCGALALFWAWELNYFFVAYLSGETSAELAVLRALVTAAVAAPLAMGFSRTGVDLRFRPSRAVTFQSLSLVLIGAYLFAVFFTSQIAASGAGDLARVVQVAFLLGAAALALLWLPSHRLRRWVRVSALKHLFKHRYDYRSEWIRFTHTIGHRADGGRSLQKRAIQSLANIADCGAGLLLMPDEDGKFALAADWQWEELAVPAEALPHELVRILERQALIIDFGEVREGVQHHGELSHVPRWLLEGTSTWAAIPLLHVGKLVGVIVLGKPQVYRLLDWEDFDLLAAAGQQVASYLAEQSSQDALNEATQFEEFNRRIAFVLHDIKNLSSQMSLLLCNAERHADNPEFRKDMLVTLRNSAEKLNIMLARLGRYSQPTGVIHESFDLAALARELRERFGAGHPMRLSDNGPCRVLGHREALMQALVHLIQNAVDASDQEAAVALECRTDGLRGEIAVVDTGCGMSAAFVRNELFKPFVSSKDGGFGIGAYEARAMIRGMGGRLSVESRERAGSRFVVSLPLAAASKLLEGKAEKPDILESEKV
ncbi:MAG: XrtA/PEP-CTERM system histidine kinase PrsK [Qipengyuania sp.]